MNRLQVRPTYRTTPARPGVGFLPLVAGLVSAGGAAYSAKSQSDAAEAAAEAARPSHLELRLQRGETRRERRAQEKAARRKTYTRLAIAGGVVLLGGVALLAIFGRRK